ncbi:MAG: hypothetical protein SFZ23_08435 [Planctomycetota bacterium]|nr:hypothetical protein [Planctomycetota bacterium]
MLDRGESSAAEATPSISVGDESPGGAPIDVVQFELPQARLSRRNAAWIGLALAACFGVLGWALYTSGRIPAGWAVSGVLLASLVGWSVADLVARRSAREREEARAILARALTRQPTNDTEPVDAAQVARACAVAAGCSHGLVHRLKREHVRNLETLLGRELPRIWIDTARAKRRKRRKRREQRDDTQPEPSVGTPPEKLGEDLPGDVAAIVRQLDQSLATEAVRATLEQRAYPDRGPWQVTERLISIVLILLVGIAGIVLYKAVGAGQGSGRIPFWVKLASAVGATGLMAAWSHVFRRAGWWLVGTPEACRLVRRDRRGNELVSYDIDRSTTLAIVTSGKLRKNWLDEERGERMWRFVPLEGNAPAFEIGNFMAGSTPWRGLSGSLPPVATKPRTRSPECGPESG